MLLKPCFQTCAAVSAEASLHLKTRHSSLSRCLAMTVMHTSSTGWKNSDWPKETAAMVSTCPLLPLKTTSKTPSNPSTWGWDWHYLFFVNKLLLAGVFGHHISELYCHQLLFFFCLFACFPSLSLAGHLTKFQQTGKPTRLDKFPEGVALGLTHFICT